MNRLFAAAAAVLAFAAPAYPQETGPSAFAPTVSVVKAERRTLVETLQVTGTVVAREEVMVAAEVDGLSIREVLAEEGDRVAKGAVLARLDRQTLDAQMAQNTAQIARAEAAAAQAQSQLVQSEASLVEARAALERTQALRQSGNSTVELLEQRTAAARTAEARLASSRQGISLAEADKALAQAQGRELAVKLARTDVTAPVAGLISRRNARIGAVSSGTSGDPLFRIIEDGALDLEADVLDARMPRLKVGEPVRVLAEPEREVAARVRLVPAEIDRQTRLGRVRIALPQGPDFRVGGFARATIETARRDNIAVPSSALLVEASGTRVQIVENGRIATREVTAGIVDGDVVEIRSGLQGGETVVARAGAFLRAGDAVRIAPPVASAAAAPASGG